MSKLSTICLSETLSRQLRQFRQTRQSPFRGTVFCLTSMPMVFVRSLFKGSKLQDLPSRWIVRPVESGRLHGPCRITKGICELGLGLGGGVAGLQTARAYQPIA